jgi:6-phosphogluconate dehydrogenase (decarboxylating)
MQSRIGFIGLGIMGEPMAGHILRKGYDLTVYNRTASKAASLVESGAREAAIVMWLSAPSGKNQFLAGQLFCQQKKLGPDLSGSRV